MSKRDDPFDEAFLRRLARLELLVRRARVSGASGEKTGASRGGRVEFSSHRRYAAGDDLRIVDWNVYARLERLFVKEFAREEEVSLRLVLDASASMGLAGKWNPARRLAAALIYVALAGGQRARLVATTAGGVIRDDERRGDAALPLVLERLRAIEPGGRSGPAPAVAGRRGGGRRDVLIVISDLYERDLSRRVLRAAAEKGAEIALVHWLSRPELSPDLSGAVRLRDVEDGEMLPLDVGETERAAYHARLEAFAGDWRSFAAGHGIRYVLAPADEELESLVLGTLRRGGLLR